MASTILFAGDLTASSSTSAQNPNVETDILADSTLRQSDPITTHLSLRTPPLLVSLQASHPWTQGSFEPKLHFR